MGKTEPLGGFKSQPLTSTFEWAANREAIAMYHGDSAVKGRRTLFQYAKPMNITTPISRDATRCVA